MGIFDEIGKALKKVEEDVKKSNLDKQVNEFGQELNRAATRQSSASAGTSSSRASHPGYQKLAAWMKRSYGSRIAAGAAHGDQKGLELEQLAAEACRELPAKAKAGFMAYLKKQNYEPLLK